MNRHRLAYTIEEVAETTTLGRTRLFEEIRNGRLIATKCGRRTVVLAEHLDAFLRALPASSTRVGPTAAP